MNDLYKYAEYPPEVKFLSSKEMIEAARKKYPRTSKYKHCVFYNSHYCDFTIIEKLGQFGEGILKDYEKKDDHKDYAYFTVEKDGIFVVFDYYFGIETAKVLLLFYNDLKDVEKLYDSEKVFYKNGNYVLQEAQGIGYTLVKIVLPDEEMPILNDDIDKNIMKDIDTFFKNREFYSKNKLSYKRGVLLYGPPGTGKSSIIKQVFKSMTESMNIIIDCTQHFDKDIMTYLNIVAKNSKKVLVFEDIDEVKDYDRSAFLNFLDGIEGLDNTFILATTNDISKVDRALINRPSRFDRAYYFGLPNEESRVKLINRFFVKVEDTEKLVKLTDGFTGAYFKELFIFKHIQDVSIEEAAINLRKQIEVFKMKPEETYIG